MGKSQKAKGPYWSKAWIQRIWEFTNQNFVDFDSGVVNFEALGREEYEFRKAMFFRNFKNSERAEEAFQEALEVYQSHTTSGTKSPGRHKKTETQPMQQGDRKIWGEFANVYLSDDEHNDLIRKVGNINGAKMLIDNFSASLADGSATSSNHYATLLKWMQYRKDKSESTPKSFKEAERERKGKIVEAFMINTGMIK